MKKSLLFVALLLTACGTSETSDAYKEIESYEECRMAGGEVFFNEPHECRIFGDVYFENVPKAKFVDYGPATGYYASPVGGGPYPTVVLIHGQMGLQKDVWAQARGLAKEGNVVLAVDLYNEQKPKDTEAAVVLEATVAQDLATAFANIEEAAKWLSLQYNVTEEPARFLGGSFGEEWEQRLTVLEEGLK